MTKEELYCKLVERHKSMIRYRCFVRYYNNTERGKDAMQDVLKEIWVQLKELSEPIKIENEKLWVLNIVRRELAAQNRTKQAKFEMSFERITDTDYFKENVSDDYELIEEIKQELKADEKLLQEKILHGFGNKEIAQIMNLKPNTVAQRKSRLEQKMKEIYDKLYGNKK